jgi:tRNA A37 threonylcarbamoyladenosine synthetase subunit TsaC/SUA5/YrdC
VEGQQLSTAASTIIDIDHKKVIRAGLLDGRMILEQLGK